MADVQVSVSLAGVQQVQAGIQQLQGRMQGLAKVATPVSVSVGKAGDAIQTFKDSTHAAIEPVTNLKTALAGLAGVFVAGAIVSAARGIVSSVSTVIGAMAELKDASETLGISGNELSKLSYAAKVNGIELDILTRSLSTLSKTIQAVEWGQITPGARALSDLGISAKNADGSLKSAGQVMAEVATEFAGMADGAQKAAYAIALFRNPELIPFLNLGAAGIKRLTDEAERFGVVASNEAAAAADELNENWKRLQLSSEGLATKLSTALLPGLIGLSETLLKVSENVSSIPSFAILGATWDVFSAAVAGATQNLREYLGIASQLPAATSAVSEHAKSAAAAMQSTITPTTAVTAAVIDFKAATDRLSATMQAHTGFLQPVALAWNNYGALLTEVKPKTDDVAAGQARLNQVLSATPGIIQSVQTPLEAYRQKLAEIQAALQLNIATQGKQGITAQQAAGATMQANAGIANSYFAAAGAASQALTELFQGNKAVAYANAVINTAEAVTAALKNPPGPPLSYVYAAAAAAQGAAQIAVIARTQPQGAQTGGIIGNVPGSGIGDKIPAMLEPGEFVVNKRAAAMHMPILERINSAVPRFANGGKLEAAKISTIEIPSLKAEVPGVRFAVGGIVPQRRTIADRAMRVGRAIPDVQRLLPAMPDFQIAPRLGNLARQITRTRELVKEVQETRTEIVRETGGGAGEIARGAPSVVQNFYSPVVADGITMGAFAKRTGDEYSRQRRRRRGFRGGE